MRFTVFISGLLLLAALPELGAAQTIPAPPRPVPDSAFAVHQLFRKHRHAAEGALGTGAASVVGMMTSAGHDEKALVGANAVVTVVSMVVGLRQALRYSADREQFLVRQYQQGWPLPMDVRRRLKPKYFRAMR